jgi:hypothetical protein
MRENSEINYLGVVGIFPTLRWKSKWHSNEYGEANYRIDTNDGLNIFCKKISTKICITS